MSALSCTHVTFTHTIFHTQLCHTHTYTHTCIHTYIHTYIRTCMLSFHMPSCFVTHHLSHSTLSHTTVLTSRSFTTSFVFPSFAVPATTFDAHYWKKLTCGVIRSFNFLAPGHDSGKPRSAAWRRFPHVYTRASPCATASLPMSTSWQLLLTTQFLSGLGRECRRFFFFFASCCAQINV